MDENVVIDAEPRENTVQVQILWVYTFMPRSPVDRSTRLTLRAEAKKDYIWGRYVYAGCREGRGYH
jgi:hypothetical protein